MVDSVETHLIKVFHEKFSKLKNSFFQNQPSKINFSQQTTSLITLFIFGSNLNFTQRPFYKGGGGKIS